MRVEQLKVEMSLFRDELSHLEDVALIGRVHKGIVAVNSPLEITYSFYDMGPLRTDRSPAWIHIPQDIQSTTLLIKDLKEDPDGRFLKAFVAEEKEIIEVEDSPSITTSGVIGEKGTVVITRRGEQTFNDPLLYLVGDSIEQLELR